MSHLDERIAEYVLGEFAEADKTSADLHVRECAACAARVNEFRKTFSLLRSVPDVDPPQRIVFETEKRQVQALFWRWLAPALSAVAAALLTALFLTQATPAPTTQTAANSQPAAAAIPVDAQAVVGQVQESCAQWLAMEQANGDPERSQEVQRVCSELAYWQSQQRAASRESFDTARSLQLLVAQRLPSEN